MRAQGGWGHSFVKTTEGRQTPTESVFSPNVSTETIIEEEKIVVGQDEPLIEEEILTSDFKVSVQSNPDPPLDISLEEVFSFHTRTLIEF